MFWSSFVLEDQLHRVGQDVPLVDAVALEVVPRAVPALAACVVGGAQGDYQPVAGPLSAPYAVSGVV